MFDRLPASTFRSRILATGASLNRGKSSNGMKSPRLAARTHTRCVILWSRPKLRSASGYQDYL